jgi:hypothetical protein
MLLTAALFTCDLSNITPQYLNAQQQQQQKKQMVVSALLTSNQTETDIGANFTANH